MKILVVEDEKSLRDVIVESLEKERYVVEVASNYNEASFKVNDYDYDCILLDITLPGGSGLDILRTIKSTKKNEGVIIISAKDSIDDKVAGLDLGADDYLAKPFKTAELVARINALLRRPAAVKDETVKYGDLVYSESEKTLNGVALTAKEAGIISELIKAEGKLIPKEFLLSKIWGGEAYGEDNYIEVYMSRLRKTMKKLGVKTQIKTSRGLGYKLVEA